MSFNILAQKFFNFLVKPVVDTIFPPVCYLCDSLLQGNRKVVCNDCWNRLKILSNSDLKQLEKVIIRSNLDNIYVLYDFTETFQQIIHLLKYERCLSICQYFANELINKFKKSFYLSYDCIVPVPLHLVKYRERGYNQSYEIIKLLPGSINNNLLLRKRQTQSQTKLTREERLMNVADAFACFGNIKTKKILLFDDIITTGSTINECAKELKYCGAANVDILCLSAPLKYTH
jgi:ComF family protein